MSWLFGYFTHKSFSSIDLSEYHPKPVSSYSDDKCYIAIGGNRNLLHFNESAEFNRFFICGLGISWDCEHILNETEWSKTLQNYPDCLTKLNGHFCGVIIKNNSVQLFTDQLGLRELHIFEAESGWYFSTRLDWLMKVQKSEIDFDVFATRWLLFNQLSGKSIVKNIIRLNQGEVAELKDNKLNISGNKWIPEKTNPVSPDAFSEKLRKIIMLGESERKKISLSLSGGMDSRVILSFLLHEGNKNWDCHTFNSDSPGDSLIAEKILSDFNIPYQLLGSTNYFDKPDVNNLFEYIGSTFMTQSAFNSIKLMNYSGLSENDIIIDGGFGEIWRREYLSHLYMRGRRFLENKDYSKAAEFLKYNRADIFNKDILSIMNQGVINQIRDVSETLPEIKEIGIENWLDLFTIKTRLGNFFAPEQTRLDSLIVSYMPFAQLCLLNDLLNFPLEERKNNKFFKNIIRKNSIELTKYKFVLGDIYYPFWFSPNAKRVYLRIHSRLFKSRNAEQLDNFLDNMKDFVMDSLLSMSAKTYAPYNYKEIHEKVNSYYKGEQGNGNYVNWFLTFEVFRQVMN